jgi:hypothetical protein
VGLRAGVRNCGLSSSRIKHASDASLSWQPNTTQDPTNGQASTVLLENLLAWCALDGITTIVSASGVTDASVDDVATILANYQVILDYLVSEGFTTILVRPYQSLVAEARALVLHELNTALSTLADGATVRVARSGNYNLWCSTAQSNQVDQIHPGFAELEGIAAAQAVLEPFALLPAGTMLLLGVG